MKEALPKDCISQAGGLGGKCLQSLGSRLVQDAIARRYLSDFRNTSDRRTYRTGRMSGIAEECHTTLMPRFEFRAIIQTVLFIIFKATWTASKTVLNSSP